MTGDRPYDVVLYGATGFTGRQTVRYLAQHAPHGLRWAIAGRDRAKLQALDAGVEIFVADSQDQAQIDRVVAHTRVVLNTAGPFAKYGTPVVDACVRFGTHYCDITGETLWIEELVARYHERSAVDAVRIVPCCGFDSVPSDLGAFIAARHHGASIVRAYFQWGGGGLNGGTVASATNIVSSGRGSEAMRPPGRLAPRRDPLIGTWVGPFFMAPVNTWVVRRSAALFDAWGEPYPADFTYEEYLKFNPPLGAIKATAATIAIGAFGLTMRSPALFRAVAGLLLPKPGEGPSETQMDRGWFSCDVVGVKPTGERVRAHMHNRGDAGNRSTVKMLCESAFCLALNECTARGGILTPATAFGDRLVGRLRDAGMTVTF